MSVGLSARPLYHVDVHTALKEVVANQPLLLRPTCFKDFFFFFWFCFVFFCHPQRPKNLYKFQYEFPVNKLEKAHNIIIIQNIGKCHKKKLWHTNSERKNNKGTKQANKTTKIAQPQAKQTHCFQIRDHNY